eukprot:9058647-Heterocapsa_arctica.AAC.1
MVPSTSVAVKLRKLSYKLFPTMSSIVLEVVARGLGTLPDAEGSSEAFSQRLFSENPELAEELAGTSSAVALLAAAAAAAA